jgi:hypothetical protein
MLHVIMLSVVMLSILAPDWAVFSSKAGLKHFQLYQDKAPDVRMIVVSSQGILRMPTHFFAYEEIYH